MVTYTEIDRDEQFSCAVIKATITLSCRQVKVIAENFHNQFVMFAFRLQFLRLFSLIVVSVCVH